MSLMEGISSGRQLEMWGETVFRVCAECGQGFETKYPTKKYCCRRHAKRSENRKRRRRQSINPRKSPDYVCPETGYRGISGWTKGKCDCKGCKRQKSISNKAYNARRRTRQENIALANSTLAQMLKSGCVALSRLSENKSKIREYDRQQAKRRNLMVLSTDCWCSSSMHTASELNDCKFRFRGASYGYKNGCRCERCKAYELCYRKPKKRTQADKIADSMSICVRRSLKRNQVSDTGRTAFYLGMHPSRIAEYLLNHPNNADGKFTLDNFGTTWEIDHIRPLASFDLLNEKHRLLAFNFRNLQPLTAVENRHKDSWWNGWWWSAGRPVRRQECCKFDEQEVLRLQASTTYADSFVSDHREYFADLPDEPPEYRTPASLLSERVVQAIFLDDCHHGRAASRYRVSEDVVCKIRYRKTYRSFTDGLVKPKHKRKKCQPAQ